MPTPAPLLVACLCAQWCRTCDAYQATLAAVRESTRADAAAEPAPPRFVWVDIEDEAELVGDLDIENFPTLLLARGDTLLFFGTVTPHAGTVERLVRGALAGTLRLAGTAPPEAHALVARLATHPSL
jgi:thiol-disulfide isomerase/thioredoxin